MSSSAVEPEHHAIESGCAADRLAPTRSARAHDAQSMPMGALRRKVADVDQEAPRDTPVCKNLSAEGSREKHSRGAVTALRCEDAMMTDAPYIESEHI
jgi:hypothetical protein